MHQHNTLPCRENAVAVADPAPYPEVAVECQNRRYACMLYDDLAACRSENTAIHRYLYHSWVLQQCDPRLAELLQRIAGVEMHHLQILGQLIVLLGGDPRWRSCCQGQSLYWSGQMLCYHTDLCSALRDDIQGESFAQKNYLRQASQIKDQKVSAMLRRLAADEQLHHSILCEALRQHSQS